MSEKPRLSDVNALRARARQQLAMGAVTAAYRGDREKVLQLLDAALASELVCVLRYRRHHFMATGLQSGPIAAEFLEHAIQEQGHADQIAARIVDLGGSPDFSPAGLLGRSHSEYVEGTSFTEMIGEDFVAERVAIESYGEMILYLGQDDPTTRRMLEGILAVEEEHATDLAELMVGLKR